MNKKYTILIWVLTFAVLFFFRYEIAGHFGLEDMLRAKEQSALPVAAGAFTNESQTTESAVKTFPRYGRVRQSGTRFYREEGRSVVGTGTAGDQVSILDDVDTGQRFINVRYNGIAGYMNRENLNLNEQRTQE